MLKILIFVINITAETKVQTSLSVYSMEIFLANKIFYIFSKENTLLSITLSTSVSSTTKINKQDFKSIW